MEIDFSITEIRLIERFLSSKTDTEIAEILDKPVELVAVKIADMTGVSKKVPYNDWLATVAAMKKACNRATAVKKEQIEKRKKVVKPVTKKKAITAPKVAVEAAKQPTEAEMDRLRSKKILQQQELARKERKERENRQLFKTRAVDLSQLISVRIDVKTTIFVKPGDDIEAAKKIYSKKITPDAADGQPLRSKTSISVKKNDVIDFSELRRGDRFYLYRDTVKVAYQVTKEDPEGEHEYQNPYSRWKKARTEKSDTKVIFLKHTVNH